MLSYLAERLHDLVDTRNEVSRCAKTQVINNYPQNFKRYRLVATLEGHSGPINAFSFNLNGTILASGGDDEVVQIWDLHVFQKYQTLADHSKWGQITCIKFLNIEQTSMAEWLCFGTGRGFLLLYHRQQKAVSLPSTHSH